MTFIPPAVSRWYRYDWQYAVDVSHIPTLAPISVILAVMPLMMSSKTLLSWLGGSIQWSLWLLWSASVCFVASLVLLYIRCPKFVREYRDFAQYKLRNHSHRWIVWEFYNNVESLSVWKDVVRETLAKGVARELDQTADSAVLSHDPQFSSEPKADDVRIFKPVNVNRDLYMPVHCDGKRLILPMEEDDEKRDAKEKELFWILYSQAAKERPRERTAYWVLIHISVVLVGLNVLKNIVLVFVHLAS